MQANNARRAASGQATRRDNVLADMHIIPHADKWIGIAAIALGWALAFADIATLHVVSATATFEMTAFASLLFGFGAGWCARGGRR